VTELQTERILYILQQLAKNQDVFMQSKDLGRTSWRKKVSLTSDLFVRMYDYELVKKQEFCPSRRGEGRTWYKYMISDKGLALIKRVSDLTELSKIHNATMDFLAIPLFTKET